MSTTQVPARRVAHRAMPALRMTRRVGVPLAVLVIAGVGAGLILLKAGMTSPELFGVGLIPTLLFFSAAVMAYVWLDRWEPEPLRLLIFAFLWGAGVAAGGALLISMLITLNDDVLEAVVQGPVVEESLKGLFLVVMLTGSRRREMNTLTDFLVYAGLVGLGFAFVEDLLYVARSESVDMSIMTAALRLVLGIFAHPFFTSATAIGLYFAAMRTRSRGMKILYGVGGFLGAMALHALWNGSATLGLGYYLAMYVGVCIPLFAGLVVLAVRSRRSEGVRLNLQLPGMVREGLILDREAAWIGTLPSRRARFAVVKQSSGAQAAVQVRHFCDAVTELAIVRDRIARGRGGPETEAMAGELAVSVQLERAEALPALVQAAQLVPDVAIQPFRLPPQVGAAPAPLPGWRQPVGPPIPGASPFPPPRNDGNVRS